MTEAAITRTGVIGLGAMGLRWHATWSPRGSRCTAPISTRMRWVAASTHGVHPCGSAGRNRRSRGSRRADGGDRCAGQDLVRASGPPRPPAGPGAVICIASSDRAADLPRSRRRRGRPRYRGDRHAGRGSARRPPIMGSWSSTRAARSAGSSGRRLRYVRSGARSFMSARSAAARSPRP